MTRSIDFQTMHGGSVISIAPISEQAVHWLRTNLEFESWQRAGGMIAMEPRQGLAVIHDVIAEGFTVQDAHSGMIAGGPACE